MRALPCALPGALREIAAAQAELEAAEAAVAAAQVEAETAQAREQAEQPKAEEPTRTPGCLFSRIPALAEVHRVRSAEQFLGITEETKKIKARQKAAYDWDVRRRRGEEEPLPPPAPATRAEPTPPHLRESAKSTSFAVAGGGVCAQSR